MGNYLLGIDSGTSGVKTVIFDLEGREVAVARRETPVLSRVPNGSELDMHQVWTLCAEAIAEVVQAIDRAEIAAIGISGTACGVWAIDEQGNPVREAILWNDGRAADIVERWQADGFLDRVWDISGNAMFPGYPLVALRWLTEHEPDVLDRASAIMFHKDWLRYKLTGALATDESDALYFPADVRARKHDPALLDEAGLTPYREKLVRIVRSQDVVAGISPEAAAHTGLPAGIPVVAGAVDVIASTLGGGAYRAGQAVSILGTSFLNTLVSVAPTFEPRLTGVQTAMPESLWGRSLVNTTGTMGIEWMVRTLAEPERQQAATSNQNVYQLIEAQIASIPIGARGVMFLPYLNTAGVISPFTAPHARGQFFGLSVEHTRFDMIRAVYEGTALAMRDCYAGIQQPIEEVLLVGGGARSAFWAQMFADATGKRIVVPQGSEFGARGAAILAGVGAGVFPSFDAAMERFSRPDRVYEPHAEAEEHYRALYELYCHLYQSARPGWELRRQVMSGLPAS